MSKKKIIVILTILVLCICLIGCGILLSKKETKEIDTTTSKLIIDRTIETSKKLDEEITNINTTTTNKSSKKTSLNITTIKKTSSKTTTTLDYKIATEEESDEETKYGTIIKTIYKVKYKIYNDGRKEEIERKKAKKDIDSTNYNGTTDILKTEAISVVNTNKDIYNEMLNYVNSYRNEISVSSLTIDTNLNLAATIRAIEMAYADKFSHTRPNGTDCFTIIDELGISSFSVGENIAAGQKNVVAVSDSWKKSNGHYQNMISTNFHKVGFGKYKLNDVNYWVQIFSS